MMHVTNREYKNLMIIRNIEVLAEFDLDWALGHLGRLGH